jgi:tRNA threonylcarbamoyladenosine biosynthesis protein TsaE
VTVLFEIKTFDHQQTKKLGEIFAKLLKPGYMIRLEGDLGAGKTTFVQGVGAGLDIRDRITSPTFTILHQYDGKIPLNHIDAYRIDFLEEIRELGLEEVIDGQGITFVEWPDKIESILPEEMLYIKINKTEDDQRNISFDAIGNDYLKVIKELEKSVSYRFR